MTHDELLAIVNKYCEDVVSGQIWTTEVFIKALCAVVELHKPFEFENGIDEYKPVCSHCQLGVVGDTYPCETIQAIENELR